MEVTKNVIVSIDFTLKDDQGELIDSSDGSGPLVYLQGHGNIISGLEDALLGKHSGDAVTVRVAPDGAYGERDEKLVQTVLKSQVEGAGEFQEGQQLNAESENGTPMVLTVTKVEDHTITVDGNHPLAGLFLNFDVIVRDVRTAESTELEQGYPTQHGTGCSCC